MGVSDTNAIRITNTVRHGREKGLVNGSHVVAQHAAAPFDAKAEAREAMVGIEYRDTDAFIDEILAAYKPIDQVVADAASLVRVRVRHTLRQIVKGD